MADKPLAGLDFLLKPSAERLRGVCALVGDDAYIKHEVITAIRSLLLGEGDAELAWHARVGRETDWADVADEVSSRSLFSTASPVVLIEEADPFITRHRDQLEDHAAKQGAGPILLDAKTLPANTRLAKAILKSGLYVRCTTPDRGAELTKHRNSGKKWLAQRAKAIHGVKLAAEAAERLFELLPMELGLLDQEVARLSLLVDEQKTITTELVAENVGGWRVRTAWEMIDAVVEGRAADALGQLDRLLLAGEQPIGVLAQLGSTLRKFATAAVAIEQMERGGRRASLPTAIKQAGFPPFKAEDAQRQLRQIGRARAQQLATWVLEADLSLKGHNAQPQRARTELERLIVRLSAEAAPAR